MTIQHTIEQKLEQAFNSDHVAVENESHKHNVPPNSETHFKVTLVSPTFEGQGKVKRHQSIYGLLAEEMSGGVHALALHLYSPDEWAKSGQAAPESPNCLGGSKHDPAFASGGKQ
jgi:BolA protein